MNKVVAKTLIKDANGLILVLHRSKTHPKFAEHFDLPGGEVEKNEKWPEAAAREVLEETGIIIDSTKFKQIYTKKYPHVTHVLFDTEIDSKKATVTLSWEHMHYEWLSVKEVLNEFHRENIDTFFLDVLNYLDRK
jgi:8-oxo-dGTP pyrophosphatase MutT (NUDIX family)